MENYRQKQIVWTGWISMSVNVFLFIIKYWVGIVSGSIALIADAWDTFIDCITSVIVIIGGKFASKPADNEHPFGHGRTEHITAMAIGVFLAILSWNFIVNSYEKFISHEGAQFGTIAIIVTAVSILLKVSLAKYEMWISKNTNSGTLKANGINHYMDSLASAMILAGIFLNKYFWWMDSLMALIIALIIAYGAYKIISKEINAILGQEISPELIEEITSEVYNLVQQDVHLHHFHLHDYGRHKELSFHIKLSAEMSLDEVHDITTRIEIMMSEKFGITTTIHPEPLKKSLI